MNRIAKLRKEKGINQLQLAEFLNVSQAAISKWEQGTHEPDLENLFKLADYFGCSLDYLTGYVGGDCPASRRTLKEYMTGRFAMSFRDSEIEYIDRALDSMVKLIKERFSK